MVAGWGHASGLYLQPRRGRRRTTFRRRRDTSVTGRPDKLLVLDTPSLYFRAFYGIPDTITASDGTPVNAIRGLLDFIARLVRDRRPARFVAAMDEDWRPAWRVRALPSYKAHRVGPDGGDQTPPGLA